ncbi:hypothetical protein TRIUR3_24693 [Triticum urartu]|uniref:Uncharacterized protein n=2 Tax=Triticum TaxID=4564 RepID=A0A9R1P989_TRITD|nr:hypothetical protein TRIUR3_24693 [Triticum urartu]VAH38937.1 unnamed protein product [Triticum turgidum subsp. durum]
MPDVGATTPYAPVTEQLGRVTSITVSRHRARWRKLPSGARRASSSPAPEQQDTLTPLPVFPFLTDDGPVFLPQFDLGLAGFQWTTPTATDHLYDGLGTPWGGCDGALAPTGAWDDFGGLELTWPLAAGN